MTPDKLDALAARLTSLGQQRSQQTGMTCHDTRQAAAALRACAERLRGEEWQPIETAPRDGTRVLLWRRFYANGEWHIGSYDEDKYSKRPKPFWLSRDLGVADSRRFAPTHWRPRPAPPAEEG